VRDLFFRQPVKLVDQGVYLLIRGLYLTQEGSLLVGSTGLIQSSPSRGFEVESILIIMSMVSSISKKEGRITGYMYLIVELNIFADFSSTLFLKRNTPQLAAAGIKGMRIQLRIGSA
jgi:hypothetical protein